VLSNILKAQEDPTGTQSLDLWNGHRFASNAYISKYL